jgi:uncharacterized protein with HEPN domain
MAAFRNVLVHDYLGLDVERIWDVVAGDLPPLCAALEAILARLERQSG